MIEKIKEQIDKNKNDKKSFRDYIDAFVNTEQVKEYYIDNSSFDELSDSKKGDETKEEDEFF